MDLLGNFTIGTVTTFVTSKATGYFLVRLTKTKRFKDMETTTIILIISIATGLIIGIYQALTVNGRHMKRVLKKLKRV